MNTGSRSVKRWLGVFGVVVAWSVWGGVFDDAAAWWTFDQGGVDGAVATKAEIHDARNPSQNQPTALYGAQGGPVWSVLDVRLPHQKRTVRGTALRFPCETRMNGTTPQCWYSSLAFDGLQHHGSELTVVARVRLEGNSVSAADAILWNNAFSWGANAGSALGFIKGASGTLGDKVTYFPYVFVAQNSYGNAVMDKTIPMKIGEWYDIAYLLSEEVVDGTRHDVVTYVVADVAGVRTYTARKASKRNAAATTTYARMGSMNPGATTWVDYNANISGNSGDPFKNFSGWIHQLAVWKRRLTLDEVKEAFGRPAEHPEQDVYADASNWIRFDTDLNGDGKVQADEVRDLRHWNRPRDGQPVIIEQKGPLGGPVWTNMTVDLPGRGVSVVSDCLYFPIETNVSVNASGETVYSAWPSSLRLANTVRAGSYTVMARIYPHMQPGAMSGVGVNAYFYNNGLDWGSWSGSEFGIGATDGIGNAFTPRITIARSTYEAWNLTMHTNAWYDIAFSVTDAGKDANGKDLADSVIVAVQDVKHGFRHQTIGISTNAYTVFASWSNATGLLGGEGAYGQMADFYKPETKTQINYANATKTFRGAIHELVVWNRALSVEEIGAAFSHPHGMVMGVGTADGANGEFAGADGTYDCTVDADGARWRDIAGALDADHPELTLRFTPDANSVGFVHYLHVKAAGMSGQAKLSLRLNGRSLASAKDVGAYDDLWCVVPRTALQKGENVLKVVHAGGAAFALDSAEIVGSWQLGVKDTNNYEFTQEGSERAAPDFMVGNRRIKHVVRAVTGGWKNNYIHFYVPAEIAAKHAFAFESAMSDQEGGAADNLFAIDLNGVEKFVAPTGRKMAKGEPIAFEVAPGELNPGWNTIHLRYVGGSWLTFDFFQFRISDYNPGTIFLLR